MTSWKFLNSDGKEKIGESWFTEYEKYEDVPPTLHSLIKESMFKNFYPQEILSELTKCVRVMPHHQNTSGFFITVIEKIGECTNDNPIIAEEDIAEPKSNLVI